MIHWLGGNWPIVVLGVYVTMIMLMVWRIAWFDAQVSKAEHEYQRRLAATHGQVRAIIKQERRR